MISLDNSKMMLLYFIIAGLDNLQGLKHLTIPIPTIIDWIYSQQCFSANNGGFLGGPYLGFEFHCSEINLKVSSNNFHHKGHLVYTYSALITLKILGDDFSRLRRKNLLEFLRDCQNEDGSFRATIDSNEADLRFIYSACVVCSLLKDFTTISIKSATEFILKCQNNDGAFGLRPNEESHSGASYCAIATLAIFNKLEEIPNKTKLVEFLVNRQISWNPSRENGKIGGFQGRINKYPDSCYSFWNGATLKILGLDSLINRETVKPYILNCQDVHNVNFI